jgi:hypothetical protein
LELQILDDQLKTWALRIGEYGSGLKVMTILEFILDENDFG